LIGARRVREIAGRDLLKRNLDLRAALGRLPAKAGTARLASERWKHPSEAFFFLADADSSPWRVVSPFLNSPNKTSKTQRFGTVKSWHIRCNIVWREKVTK